MKQVELAIGIATPTGRSTDLLADIGIVTAIVNLIAAFAMTTPGPDTTTALMAMTANMTPAVIATDIVTDTTTMAATMAVYRVIQGETGPPHPSNRLSITASAPLGRPEPIYLKKLRDHARPSGLHRLQALRLVTQGRAQTLTPSTRLLAQPLPLLRLFAAVVAVPHPTQA